MTVLEMRKWINSLPTEFDSFELTHREYYDSNGDDLFAHEVNIVSIHIDDIGNTACLMHEESYMKYKGDSIYTKLEVKDLTAPTHG
jgi:hypothetical protein